MSGWHDVCGMVRVTCEWQLCDMWCMCVFGMLCMCMTFVCVTCCVLHTVCEVTHPHSNSLALNIILTITLNLTLILTLTLTLALHT